MKYIFLLIPFFLLSCSKKEEVSNGLVKVTIQLNWMAEAEHGGYYEALDKGYYRDLGLEVEILTGGPGVRVESETALGRVDFGIANADKVLTVRDKGIEIVALMSPFESSPRCVMVHAESTVKDFESLAHSEVLIINNTKPFYFWLVDKYPALKDVDTIPYNKATFMTTKKAAMQGYLNSEPLIMKEKGLAVRTLKVSATGFDPYTSVLICSQKFLSDKPEIVEKIKKASVKGWLSYLKAPQKTNELIEKVNPANKGTLNASTTALLELMCKQDENFGIMDLERWKILAKQLLKIGVIKTIPLDFKQIVP